MTNTYFIADVFTQQAFNGAQIAVFPNAEQLNDRQMQLLARELNLSETVFVQPSLGHNNHRKIRIFSPTEEINFVGHPIIATAYVLASCGELELGPQQTDLVLEQNASVTEAAVTTENGQVTFVQYTQQVESVVDRFAPSAQELGELLSIDPETIDNRTFGVRLVAAGSLYLIVPVYEYETVRAARFNYNAWAHSTAPQTSAQEILLFSGRNPNSDANFNVRLLGPNIGLQDDPPVGSAMPAFAAYLASHEHIQTGTHSFAVDRGDNQTRRSVLNLEMDHQGKPLLTIRVGGEAVMVAEGQIQTP